VETDTNLVETDTNLVETESLPPGSATRHRPPTAQQVRTDQVIPGTVDTYLDHITRELIVFGSELREPIVRIDHAPTIALQLVSVHVTHPTQGVVRTHRAGSSYLLSDVLARPYQLRVGITDVG
jgi:hypothetical protein